MALDTSQPTTVGLIILTTGTRPADLDVVMAAASELSFDERVIVGNGVEAPSAAGWQVANSPTNLGVPGGRSFGMEHSTADIVIFLDDDSLIPAGSGDLVSKVRAVFDRDLTVGALALRVVVTGTDETLRRWSPRPTTNSVDGIVDVPTFPGNGHAVRRSAFDDVGGYLDALFFKHEETELSWRLIDHGWRVVTDSTIVVEHPRTSESRHDVAIEFGLRNKLWISRLRLPLPVAILGSLVSTVRAFARCRSAADLSSTWRGLRAGVGTLPARREPVSWSTVATLTKSGRPPIF